MGTKKSVSCSICGQLYVLDEEKAKGALQKYSDAPVDISAYDLVCYRCSQTNQYREKYVKNNWSKHFILGPNPPAFKRNR